MASEKGKVYTPILPPPSIYKDDPRAVLSDTEGPMYEEVLAHFTAEDPVYTLPGVDPVEKGKLEDKEKFWLSRECILRFLRASKWNKDTAITRLENTLKWRRGFGIDGTIVTAEHVEEEAVTGKEIAFGYDTKGRPGFYMIPSRQNTAEAKRQIEFAFWMVERCIDLMEPGVENLTLLINFADRAKNPSISTARSVLSILQEHYPERLGLALIINVPFLINAFFKIIMPFVDPVTRDKVKFNPKVYEEEFLTKEMSMKQWWGGDQDFEYVHEKYWPELVRMCEERSAAWKENWKKLGAKVGISEWDYKTRKESSVVPVEDVEKQDEAVSTVEAVDATKETDQNGSDSTVKGVEVVEKDEAEAIDATKATAQNGTVEIEDGIATPVEAEEIAQVGSDSFVEVAEKQVEPAVATKETVDVGEEQAATTVEAVIPTEEAENDSPKVAEKQIEEAIPNVEAVDETKETDQNGAVEVAEQVDVSTVETVDATVQGEAGKDSEAATLEAVPKSG